MSERLEHIIDCDAQDTDHAAVDVLLDAATAARLDEQAAQQMEAHARAERRRQAIERLRIYAEDDPRFADLLTALDLG